MSKAINDSESHLQVVDYYVPVAHLLKFYRACRRRY